jgi:hypothetical protein
LGKGDSKAGEEAQEGETDLPTTTSPSSTLRMRGLTMTNNPTIDGVSREFLLNKCACGSTDISFCYESPQGHWILCDECGETSPLFENRGSALDHWNNRAPAVERQEPVAYANPKAFENFGSLAHLGGLYAHEWMFASPAPELVPLYVEPPEVAALQSTIAQLEDKLNKAINLDFQRRETIARLEGKVQELESWRGEPVCYQARHSAEEPWFFTDKPGYWEWRPLFTAPPAPVSMVLPERRTPEHYHARIGKCGAADMLAEEWNACLDAAAALNGEWK